MSGFADRFARAFERIADTRQMGEVAEYSHYNGLAWTRLPNIAVVVDRSASSLIQTDAGGGVDELGALLYVTSGQVATPRRGGQFDLDSGETFVITTDPVFDAGIWCCTCVQHERTQSNLHRE